MSVRVAVVGLGWAGRELWLPLLREHNDFKVVAAVVADRPRGRRSRRRREFRHTLRWKLLPRGT